MPSKSRVTTLVLDAGALLSLTPLKGLAENYVTVPQVLEELKDNKAREHFEKLGLISGVKVELRNPDEAALTQVISAAKKTGDYSVLSKPDLSILALTYALDEEWKTKQTQENSNENIPSLQASPSRPFPELVEDFEGVNGQLKSLNLSLEKDLQIINKQNITPPEKDSDMGNESEGDLRPPFEDPPSDDDGEGEWITPDNVALHKSRALALIPSETASKTKECNKEEQHIYVGCMTADFAMQNVLLYMDLHLVDIEGKRISQLKKWVLRCHACFKICKDPSKKFCPSCGNPTLLRTSVTISAPVIPGNEPTMQIHLKKNFQYRNRGTKYSIPLPKPGSSKTGSGDGLILRADQTEWLRAEKRAETQRKREEKRMLNAVGTSIGTGVKLDWMDPDWLPEMFTTSAGGKGKSFGKDGMPTIGCGRRNPNEKRRK